MNGPLRLLGAPLLALVLLAGCATPAHPAATATSTVLTSTATATATTTAAPAPKQAPPPPPQVGACDMTETSGGLPNQEVRTGTCKVSDALSSLDPNAKSLLVEVTWDSLPATVTALHASLENNAACPPGNAFGGGCSTVAQNTSLAKPVRVVLEGDAFTKYAADATAFVTLEGAAAQQQFHLAFSAFAQEHVPAGYTALT